MRIRGQLIGAADRFRPGMLTLDEVVATLDDSFATVFPHGKPDPPPPHRSSTSRRKKRATTAQAQLAADDAATGFSTPAADAPEFPVPLALARPCAVPLAVARPRTAPRGKKEIVSRGLAQ